MLLEVLGQIHHGHPALAECSLDPVPVAYDAAQKLRYGGQVILRPVGRHPGESRREYSWELHLPDKRVPTRVGVKAVEQGFALQHRLAALRDSR